MPSILHHGDEVFDKEEDFVERQAEALSSLTFNDKEDALPDNAIDPEEILDEDDEDGPDLKAHNLDFDALYSVEGQPKFNDFAPILTETPDHKTPIS